MFILHGVSSVLPHRHNYNHNKAESRSLMIGADLLVRAESLQYISVFSYVLLSNKGINHRNFRRIGKLKNGSTRQQALAVRSALNTHHLIREAFDSGTSSEALKRMDTQMHPLITRVSPNAYRTGNPLINVTHHSPSQARQGGSGRIRVSAMHLIRIGNEV